MKIGQNNSQQKKKKIKRFSHPVKDPVFPAENKRKKTGNTKNTKKGDNAETAETFCGNIQVDLEARIR